MNQPFSILETTPPIHTYKLLGWKRFGQLYFADEIQRRVNLRHNDIILQDSRAMLAMEHPHYGWTFRDVTGAFLGVTGDQADIDKTHLGLLEATR